MLISPIEIGNADWMARVLPVSISKEQVTGSPHIDTDKPVSRLQEMQHLGYYGYPVYWGGVGLWGGGLYPGAMLTGARNSESGAEYLLAQADRVWEEAAGKRRLDNSDPCLRSCNVLLKYRIEATDGGMGQAKGLLLDEENLGYPTSYCRSEQLVVRTSGAHRAAMEQRRKLA